MNTNRLAQFRRVSDEVYYAPSPFCPVYPETIEELKAVARQNARGRVRICFHASPAARLHDMLIVLTGSAVYPAHKHLNKEEAFHLIEGRLRVMLHADDGAVEESVDLAGPPPHGGAGTAFYCRIPMNKFHTVIPLSETVVFREVTDGPFVPEQTVFADWPAPRAG